MRAAGAMHRACRTSRGEIGLHRSLARLHHVQPPRPPLEKGAWTQHMRSCSVLWSLLGTHAPCDIRPCAGAACERCQGTIAREERTSAHARSPATPRPLARDGAQCGGRTRVRRKGGRRLARLALACVQTRCRIPQPTAVRARWGQSCFPPESHPLLSAGAASALRRALGAQPPATSCASLTPMRGCMSAVDRCWMFCHA